MSDTTTDPQWLSEAIDAAARLKYETYDSHYSMAGGLSWGEYAAEDPDGADALHRADSRAEVLAALPVFVEAMAVELNRQAEEFRAEDEADGCESRFCAGWLLGQAHAADVVNAFAKDVTR